MKLIKKNNIILQPEAHPQMVHLFLSHFQLSATRPDLIYLQQIVEKFTSIPYENISKIIKLSQHWGDGFQIRLPDEVLEEHLSKHLGGTCFSLTFMLQSILTQQGFICYPVMAHMRAGLNIHCALIVVIDNTHYLVDPGYVLNQPVAIKPLTRRTHLREFGGVEIQFDPESGDYHLFTFDRKELKWRYRFQDRACSNEEFLQHWLSSFTKPMMHGLCLTKVTKSGLIYIHKNHLRQITFSEKKNFKLKHNLHETIHTIFGIDKNLIEWAQAAVDLNMAKEVELGIFNPATKKRLTSVSF